MSFLSGATFFIYFGLLLTLVFIFYHKQKSDTDFVIGDRSLNFWLTALSAHASDMSNWLFMGYPALIYTGGIFGIWTALGLIFFMYLNWQFVAPKVRVLTEKTKSLTLNAYFEHRFSDSSGIIRVLSSFISLLFYVVYISAGLIGMGFLVDTLFGLSYFTGITIGLGIVAFYVFIGGYLTVAWIDLFQGLFLLVVIVTIPCYLLGKLGGTTAVFSALETKHLSLSLLPDYSLNTILKAISLAVGWGLGYFGQPHIITKFMGIKHSSEIHKAKWVGITWQTFALFGATIFGLLGVILFKDLANPELISLEVVKKTLPSIFSALILCAILAATTNVIAAQILVVASSLAEDFYKRLINKEATHFQILKVSRASVLFIALISYVLAFFKISTIYKLVLYAWTGIGASFGPLLLISLHYKKVNFYGALAGIISGALISAIWPLFNQSLPAMIPAFAISSLMIYLFSNIKMDKHEKTTHFNH
jgi:sodium/proline symporter